METTLPVVGVLIVFGLLILLHSQQREHNQRITAQVAQRRADESRRRADERRGMLSASALRTLDRNSYRKDFGRFHLGVEVIGGKWRDLLVDFTTDTGINVSLEFDSSPYPVEVQVRVKLDGQHFGERQYHNVSEIEHPRVRAVVAEAIQELEQLALRLEWEDEEKSRQAKEKQRRTLDRL